MQVLSPQSPVVSHQWLTIKRLKTTDQLTTRNCPPGTCIPLRRARGAAPPDSELPYKPDLHLEVLSELLCHLLLCDGDQLANILCGCLAEIHHDVGVNV